MRLLVGSLLVIALAAAPLAQPVFRGDEIFPPDEYAARRTKLLDKIGDTIGYDCGEHGRFRVVETIFATADIDRPRAEWEAALKRAKARQPNEWASTIMTTDF